MATKNIALSKLVNNSTYNETFNREIIGRVKEFQASHPHKTIYMMAWGDTSKELPPTIVKTLIDAATKLGQIKTYTGYEEINGNLELKKTICNQYYREKSKLSLILQKFLSVMVHNQHQLTYKNFLV